MIHEDRIRNLNKNRIEGGHYVLYWMQQSQRAEFNHALEYAIIRANELELPLLVFFSLTASFPEANERHYRFMLQGLQETKRKLQERGINMFVRICSPESGVVELAKKAALVVTDRGYLRIQRQWREAAASRMQCALVQVESDAIVPVETASKKEEYTAGTFRPKISALLPFFLKPVGREKIRVPSQTMNFESEDISNIDDLLGRLAIDRSVKPVRWLTGGTKQAKRILTAFIREKLDSVPDYRNDPAKDILSNMSPYLHFGQISPVYIALEILKTESLGRDIFLEELIVRRELGINFSFYNDRYDSFECLPEWARKTLREHSRDRREYLYDMATLEKATTHDPYWNAAQKELVLRGKMHGYMRMYWGKKILEWSGSPELAYAVALLMNNKYSIDGRDPNGFAGIAWCFGKHDRAWGERPIFGKIRYMNTQGLNRKFDMDEYVARVGSYA